jgi:hypothetical protein
VYSLTSLSSTTIHTQLTFLPRSTSNYTLSDDLSTSLFLKVLLRTGGSGRAPGNLKVLNSNSSTEKKVIKKISKYILIHFKLIYIFNDQCFTYLISEFMNLNRSSST